jgi:hypothetical protein
MKKEKEGPNLWIAIPIGIFVICLILICVWPLYKDIVRQVLQYYLNSGS